MPISRSILWKYRVGSSSTMMLTGMFPLEFTRVISRFSTSAFSEPMTCSFSGSLAMTI